MNTWLGSVRIRLQLARTRAQLLNLTEAQLRDVGLTREQAWREASTPPWRGVPGRANVPRQNAKAAHQAVNAGHAIDAA
ncbi:DUF1127 domain-containing protein [Achromobacter sp. KS-M25]|nr:DUF1127 domain-containing protein [Achromobacter aestuarii]